MKNETTAIDRFVQDFADELQRVKGWGGIHLDSDVEGFPEDLAFAVAHTAANVMRRMDDGGRDGDPS